MGDIFKLIVSYTVVDQLGALFLANKVSFNIHFGLKLIDSNSIMGCRTKFPNVTFMSVIIHSLKDICKALGLED